MNEEASFVQAMLEAPDDMALRLVFADWLEERGDPRGELLRLTHTLTQAIDVPQRAELEARLQALLRDGVQPVGPYWTNELGMHFAWVPAGTFLMGSPEEEVEGEDGETQHKVVLTRGFWLGIYPVTQQQWQKVMGGNPSWFCAEGNGKEQVQGLDTRPFPVENMTWEETMEFCARLTRLEGVKTETYRLPTEAQWEYACRAGTRTPFHFGAGFNGTEANCCGEYPDGTSSTGKYYLGRTGAVGTYIGNAFGLFDMHGNVCEWCADWFAEETYQRGTRIDPGGPFEGACRVLRGGSWCVEARVCRSASRDFFGPDDRFNFMGFRLARGSVE